MEDTYYMVIKTMYFMTGAVILCYYSSTNPPVIKGLVLFHFNESEIKMYCTCDSFILPNEAEVPVQ